MEVWKDVKGYEGLYQVSNLGRVKSLKRQRNANLMYSKTATVPERILKYGVSQGYLAVTLAKNKVNTKIRVHKLVAINFIPNPENKPYINHKDGNKHNNAVDNLEWATPKENTKHAIDYGLINCMCTFEGHRHTEETKKRMRESRKWGSSKYHRVISQYTKDGKFIKEWNGFVEIEKVLGYDRRNLQSCCKNKIPSAYGYIWRYADEQNNIQPTCNGEYGELFNTQ